MCRLLAGRLNSTLTTHARSLLFWSVSLPVFWQHQIPWECSSSSSCSPCWCATTPRRWSALKILHSLNSMCSVEPVQKDETQDQKIFTSSSNPMINHQWNVLWMLLGPQCLPLSVVKQMCYFFALNSQSIDLKDAFFFGSSNFFLHPLCLTLHWKFVFGIFSINSLILPIFLSWTLTMCVDSSLKMFQKMW